MFKSVFLPAFVAAILFAAAPSALAGEACLDVPGAKDTAYVVAVENGHTMCGELSTFPSAQKETDAVWFRIDDATWVVRDPAVVAEAGRLFREVNAIGEEQGRLGAKQGKIGAKQGKIGAEQGKLAVEQAAAGLRGDEVEDHSARMEELGAEMAALGKEQAAFGEQQSALGKKMRVALDEAQEELSRLLDRAMRDGTAVRVKRL